MEPPIQRCQMSDLPGNDIPGNSEAGAPRRSRVLGMAALLVALLIVVAGALWVYRTAESFSASWEITRPEFEVGAEGESGEADDVEPESENPAIVQEQAAPEASAPNLFEPWAGTERVNVLLLGIDQRCDESGPTHTDSMMVASIDPATMSAVALSLPRDLWVEIPNIGLNRINQAHYFGEARSYPGGGPALAAETVEALLGIPIHYYGAVNFDAFTEFVDLIGGIEVVVPQDIDDPKYPDRCYGYEPFQISAGLHHLDGAQALKYARTRATFGGDVDRAGRQQQVVMAVRDAIDVDMVPRLLTQAPLLWQSFQENVRTNMTLDEAIQLALLAMDIPRENYRLAVIDYGSLYPETMPDGQQVLVPRREGIRELRDALFAPAPIPRPTVEVSPERIAQENARVAILNGTPHFGLAATTQAYLESYNVNVVSIGNADAATYPTTRIYDFTAAHETANVLAQLLEVPPLNVMYEGAEAGDYDILIIIGADSILAPTPTPTPAP